MYFNTNTLLKCYSIVKALVNIFQVHLFLTVFISRLMRSNSEGQVKQSSNRIYLV